MDVQILHKMYIVSLDTFKDILRFIDDNYMTSVKAIIWNINPNVRCDRLLTSQANLINKFSPKNVWNNVIIIAKQSMSPEDDCRYGDFRIMSKWKLCEKLENNPFSAFFVEERWQLL